jgi:hypothetical protein
MGVRKTCRLGPLPDCSPGVVPTQSSSGHGRFKRIYALEQRLPTMEARDDNVLVQDLLKQVMHGIVAWSKRIEN